MPVAILRKRMKSTSPWHAPEAIVAPLQRIMLNTIIHLRLILSATKPEIGTSSAKTRLNSVAISPASPSVSFRVSLIGTSSVL